MQTLVYQLVQSRTDTVTDDGIPAALSLFREHTIPDSIFRTVSPVPDMPTRVLESSDGQAYVQDAFTRTQQAVERDITSLTDALETALTDSSRDWQRILDADGVQGAAFRLGHSRGPHAFLYDSTSSLGLRTPTELQTHLDQTNTTDGHHIHIVPLHAQQ